MHGTACIAHFCDVKCMKPVAGDFFDVCLLGVSRCNALLYIAALLPAPLRCPCFCQHAVESVCTSLSVSAQGHLLAGDGRRDQGRPRVRARVSSHLHASFDALPISWKSSQYPCSS
uniref:Uncharacterized protein n=1 Tax=Chrysotila carterae TaxID=13221 RepID=A0A6S9UUR6_CHRCT|eukprot:3946502-Pleurochrysis_carterae.AAC.2